MGRPHVEHARSPAGVELKYCGTCDRWRELSAFNRESHRWDHLCTKCRSCSTAAKQRWNDTHPTKTAEYSRKWREANLDRARASGAEYRASEHGKRVIREYDQARYYADVEQGRARVADWRKRNPEKAVAYTSRGKYARDPEKYRAARQAWRERNRERDRENLATWRAENLDSVRRSAVRVAHKRRAIKQALPSGPWTEQQLVDRDGPECWMCGKPIGSVRRNWHVDHLIPLSKPYPNHPGDSFANLAVACAPCNQWKNAKLLPAAVARYESNLT